jgi:hypothetical protein
MKEQCIIWSRMKITNVNFEEQASGTNINQITKNIPSITSMFLKDQVLVKMTGK